MSKNDYRSLTKETKQIINGYEGREVEFKRQSSGVSVEDFVAFTNASGGVILIGVDEKQDDNGRQYGEIIGCDISDRERLSIVGKALSCKPPINIIFRIENSSGKKPIIRIDISEGENKLYWTSSGVYKIRSEGQNIGIDPQLLKAMILKSESDEFVHRFKLAADEVIKKLETVEDEIINQVKRVEAIANEAALAAENASDAAQQAIDAAYDAADY